jgi:protein phosphatase
MIGAHPSTTPPTRLRWSGWTDRGKVRPHNEDSFLGLRFDANEVQRLGKFGEAATERHDYAFAVSDGMGGALAGEFASRIAVEKITTLLPRAFKQSALGLEAGVDDVLTELYTQIHRALVYLGNCYDECAGMQTTLTLAWVTPSWLYFAHIGDSRLYYLPAGGAALKQVTHDDTYVGWMFRQGQINEREARTHPRRNVLQRALGGGNQFIDPQVGAVGIEPGDTFLLCTDGLTDGLFDSAILDLLTESRGLKDEQPARCLVDTSVAQSGRDNTTALILRVEAEVVEKPKTGPRKAKVKPSPRKSIAPKPKQRR